VHGRHIFFSVSQQHKIDPVPPIDKTSPTFPNYSNGEYKPIIQLMDLMPNPLLAKAYADNACNECGVLLNLRLHIETCVARISTTKDTEARSPAYWRKQAEAGLVRYYSLLLFASYMLDEHALGFAHSFTGWMRRHWNTKRPLVNLELS
jgi:hypothetical protein